jgi:hypothetical protein
MYGPQGGGSEGTRACGPACSGCAPLQALAHPQAWIEPQRRADARPRAPHPLAPQSDHLRRAAADGEVALIGVILRGRTRPDPKKPEHTVRELRRGQREAPPPHAVVRSCTWPQGYSRMRHGRARKLCRHPSPQSALQMACRFGHLEAAKALVAKGADVNRVSLQAEAWAARACGRPV